MNKMDDKKSYSLKNTETQVLTVLQQAYQQGLAAYVSSVLLERLAYPITPNTAFEIQDGLNEVKVWENTPEPPVEPATPTVDLKGKK